MNTDQYLKVALKATKQAGKTFKQHFGKPHKISIKGGDPKDLVTEVDVAIETEFRKFIKNKFPDHLIIGEELGAPKNIPEGKMVWIIDPIDGTSNYIHGIPFCCISIALWDGQGPVVGVVYNPISNNLFHATRDGGAYCNNKRIYVSKAISVANSYSAVSWGRGWEMGKKIMPFFIKNMRKVRTFGSVALETCYVAQGNFDSFIQGRLSIWDVAAATLILTEAGGKATDWQGKPLTLQVKNLIASNSLIHNELLKMIKKL
jgi:myo-inositol-1(or 4)-monophosphatase